MYGARTGRGRIRSIALLGFLLSLLVGPSALPAEPIANEICLGCHEDPTLKKTVDGTEIPLTVSAETFQNSVHGSLSCTDCHATIVEVPHPPDLPRAQCASCHEEVVTQYNTSIHGLSQAMGASAAARCADCHGKHDIRPVNDPASPVFKLNLPRTCANCHSNPGLTSEYQMRNPDAAAHYMESIHGRALLKLGLIVAPSCNDCHGVHNIRRTVDRSSPINHANIAKTCGKCHLGVEQIYEQSVHGKLLAAGSGKGPVCTDCHTAHEIEPPVSGHFKAVSDRRCGRCHADRLKHYRETYHGKAMALGRPNQAPEVAACFDCHGYHDVLPPSDPRSHLSPANIVTTCRKCHPGANAQFALYLPHANHLDATNYPVLHWTFVFMTALLIGTFGFFGLHTILWVVRSGYLYVNDSKTFREAKIRARTDDEWFTRFTPIERFLHFLVVASFLLLVLTGMPLKFYDSGWAKGIFTFLGGPEVARSIHHFAAVITFFYFGIHLSSLATKSWHGRKRWRDPATGRFSLRRVFGSVFGPDSMVPTLQDWRDFVAHQKWFFGKGPRPEFDRWTYWERFDYFAVFWGVAAIGISGVVMWFPEFTTKFFPGWLINVALIIHSDEALLAAGFIFTFHFFNVHFRIEKFPMDPVIFSGRISKTEMLHERKRWYDRLVAEDQLDEHKVRDEWEAWKGIAHTFAYMFFGVGVVLLILIAYAMALRFAGGPP
jgi:cytochrome b subunit of formate dehydrogenase